MGKNHYIDQEMLLEDITSPKTSTQLTYVDVLFASFLAKTFSVAGYRKGFDDDRINVFSKLEIVKFLKNNRKPRKHCS